jgi:hypothetical protein
LNVVSTYININAITCDEVPSWLRFAGLTSCQAYENFRLAKEEFVNRISMFFRFILQVTLEKAHNIMRVTVSGQGICYPNEFLNENKARDIL